MCITILYAHEHEHEQKFAKFMLRLYTALLTMNVLVCICSVESNSMVPGSAKKRSLGPVKCNTCSNVDRWSKMLSWKIFGRGGDRRL